jgi:cardiolipin synthase A/B
MRTTLGRCSTGVVALCLAGALGACGNLPTIHPDMARRAASPVKVESASGPLSAAQSKAILDGLKQQKKNANLLERHLALEEAIVGSPLIAGNKIVLLEDGPGTFRAMHEAIRAARDHINVEVYILEDDEVGRDFANALIERQRRGVQVNLIYDGVGSHTTPKDFFKRLSDHGVKLVEYNPINPLTAKAGWDVNARDHRKLFVIDGQIAFVGGINISSVYSSGSFRRPAKVESTLPWRDTNLRIDGPVVAEFQKLFIEAWGKQKGPPLEKKNYFPVQRPKGKEVVRAIGSSPDEPYSLIYATLISAIANAESEVLLTNAYFVPDPQLLATLKEARARGVDVKLLLPSDTDVRLVFHAGRGYYSELLQAGVKIYERQAAMLHAKTAVVDGVWSTVGSTNLDWRSFLHNQELNAVILGADFGTHMRAMFERDLAASTQITLEQWERRPIGTRVKELMARVWEYWL